MSTSAQQPFFMGIAGGTASGKTTVCNRITQHLGGQRVVLICLDEFYRDLTPEECTNISAVNFDEPGAFDVKTMTDCLDQLRRSEATEVPVYDFVTSRRDPTKNRHVEPADVVIVEGILVLHIPELLRRFNMKVYVDTDDDVRLARRIRRDTVERGRDVEGVIEQYVKFVKPAFQQYVMPSKGNADVIIPWREENPVAVDLITQHVRTKLSQNNLTRVYRNLHLVPGNNQTRGMHTVIRSRHTSREDFVFYADRLIRLVVEFALGLLPFDELTVMTPTGDQYNGVSFSRRLCGVSVIRSGEAMENALRACCAGIRIGKILCESRESEELVFEKLPHDIAERHVLLMDPILGSGCSALNTIDYLVQRRSVNAEKIIFLSLISAPEGIHKVCSAHPGVKVITSEIDDGIGSRDGTGNFVRPGIGEFGDRYFGTTTTCEDCVMLSRRTERVAWAIGSPSASGGSEKAAANGVKTDGNSSSGSPSMSLSGVPAPDLRSRQPMLSGVPDLRSRTNSR